MKYGIKKMPMQRLLRVKYFLEALNFIDQNRIFHNYNLIALIMLFPKGG